MSSSFSASGPARAASPLIFLHLPKAGGSTLATIMARQYGSEAILPLYDSAPHVGLTAQEPCQVNDARVVMGHFYFGRLAHVQSTGTYVTMLRHPVARVVSHYYFVRREPNHYLHQRAQQMSLKAYVEACGRAEPNNDQTRLLAGTPSDDYTADMLPLARQHLREHFAVVGLTEEFDRSLLLMKRLFAWRMPLYVRQNRSSRRPRQAALSPNTLHVIRAHNEADIDLYHYAKELLRDQLRRQGNSLEWELRLFHLLNSTYGLAHRLKAAMTGNFRIEQR